jgi:uncharacterized protein
VRVLVTGASGLVGSALVPALEKAGHVVGRFVRIGPRRPPGSAAPNEIVWDLVTGFIDTAHMEGADAVVHLAGANIAGERWSEAFKARFRHSRVEGTRILAEAIARLERPPRVLVQASAVGIYGHRGDEILTESSPHGAGFLPAVCVAWEAATAPAVRRGVRVALLRYGVILSRHGGALKKMLPAFRMGVAGTIGSGRQWMPWLTLEDAVSMIARALEDTALEGPINAVAPEPVTNRDFTKTLGGVLGRPTFLPLPAFAARLALGEMADALLLASVRVMPGRLSVVGFEWRHPTLGDGLRAALADSS